jgi:hypothetical protein
MVSLKDGPAQANVIATAPNDRNNFLINDILDKKTRKAYMCTFAMLPGRCGFQTVPQIKRV